MASTCPVILRAFASSVSIAHRAGKIIRDVMSKGELGTVVKNDFQTEADRSAQRCILASLCRQYPKLSIFGEEETNPKDKVDASWIETELAKDVVTHAANVPDRLKSVKENEVVVWVGPLDGTAEYTQGLLDHVTVLIGIAYKGEAVGGVIYQPYYNYQVGGDAKLGRCFWGMLGVGNTYKYGPTVQRRNLGGVLAAPSPEQHKWYAERIPQEVKDTLPLEATKS